MAIHHTLIHQIHNNYYNSWHSSIIKLHECVLLIKNIVRSQIIASLKFFEGEIFEILSCLKIFILENDDSLQAPLEYNYLAKPHQVQTHKSDTYCQHYFS